MQANLLIMNIVISTQVLYKSVTVHQDKQYTRTTRDAVERLKEFQKKPGACNRATFLPAHGFVFIS